MEDGVEKVMHILRVHNLDISGGLGGIQIKVHFYFHGLSCWVFAGNWCLNFFHLHPFLNLA